MNYSLMTFPREILDKILELLDGKSIVKLAHAVPAYKSISQVLFEAFPVLVPDAKGFTTEVQDKIWPVPCISRIYGWTVAQTLPVQALLRECQRYRHLVQLRVESLDAAMSMVQLIPRGMQIDLDCDIGEGDWDLGVLSCAIKLFVDGEYRVRKLRLPTRLVNYMCEPDACLMKQIGRLRVVKEVHARLELGEMTVLGLGATRGLGHLTLDGLSYASEAMLESLLECTALMRVVFGAVRCLVEHSEHERAGGVHNMKYLAENVLARSRLQCVVFECLHALDGPGVMDYTKELKAVGWKQILTKDSLLWKPI
ncbi:hypothetical protein BC830DRAFT_946403 [Chytriomyces sp. MP71]|nr:hypothetical protein BC830DRAFT_946403 [Chytriomyces sp. MP71]